MSTCGISTRLARKTRHGISSSADGAGAWMHSRRSRMRASRSRFSRGLGRPPPIERLSTRCPKRSSSFGQAGPDSRGQSAATSRSVFHVSTLSARSEQAECEGRSSRLHHPLRRGRDRGATRARRQRKLTARARLVRAPVRARPSENPPFAGVSESRMRLSSPFCRARTARLSGSYVSEKSEMLVGRSPSAPLEIPQTDGMTAAASPRAVERQ